MAEASPKRTIRFEDLGGPVQDLLKKVKGVNDEDMQLFEFVSVKDMAKIYQEMGTDREAEDIWEELKAALQSRRDKAERKRRELMKKEQELNDEAAAEEEARLAEEQAAQNEAEERRKRKEERRRRRAEEAAAAEEQARLDAEAAAAEEEERLAQEEADRKAEEKRRKRAAKKRALQEEQERLEEEKEKERQKKKEGKNQKEAWGKYVSDHPLEFANDKAQEIEQVTVKRDTKPPPSADSKLLGRTFTPKCPNCQARFSKPPKDWDCPMCLRRYRQRFKCWQPDSDAPKCPITGKSLGMFTRHHCRNCGRVIHSDAIKNRASIPSLGFDMPVKVCDECIAQLVKIDTASPTASPSPQREVPAEA